MCQVGSTEFQRSKTGKLSRLPRRCYGDSGPGIASMSIPPELTSRIPAMTRIAPGITRASSCSPKSYQANKPARMGSPTIKVEMLVAGKHRNDQLYAVCPIA